MYASPLRDGGYDIADYYEVHPDYGTIDDVRAFIEAAHERGMRVIADLVMNHTSSRPRVVPARPRGAGRLARARLVRVVGHAAQRYEDARIIFTDTETSNWTWDDAGGRLLLAPLLLPPARPQLRQPRGPRGDARRPALLARPRARRLPPRRRALPLRARGHQRREPARDPRLPQAGARDHRRGVPRPRPAGRGQPVARGRRRVLRRRRRVPHGLPLPGHAAHVHGGAPRGGDADVRDPRAHARPSPRTASGACSCATTTS